MDNAKTVAAADRKKMFQILDERKKEFPVLYNAPNKAFTTVWYRRDRARYCTESRVSPPLHNLRVL